ncbi:MAG: hypothetical protein II974_08960 [Firmicutes bacterium]|nr:hypothetical protein [Bacillota bacterium]
MNDKSFDPADPGAPAGMNMPFGGPAGACSSVHADMKAAACGPDSTHSSDLFDLKEAVERLIGSQKDLLSRCEAVAASVPGRLAERKAPEGPGGGSPFAPQAPKGRGTVLVHVYKDPLTGRSRSRQLGRGDSLLIKRLAAATLCRKMIPILVYNIREAERLAGRLKPVRIDELYASLPAAIVEGLPGPCGTDRILEILSLICDERRGASPGPSQIDDQR